MKVGDIKDWTKNDQRRRLGMNELVANLSSHLNALFQGNQLLSTVAGGSVIVWAVSNIKALWRGFVNIVESCISFTVVNTYEDARRGGGISLSDTQNAFNSIVANSRVVWERSCNLDLSDFDFSESSVDSAAGAADGGSDQRNLAYGRSVRILYGKLVVCDRSIDNRQKITCTTVLRVFFGSRRKFMERLNKDIGRMVEETMKELEKKNVVRVYNDHCRSGVRAKRAMSSIFTKGDVHYGLLESIKAFVGNKALYERLSYPYNYSALLYGEPGCGKTSTILAIASELGRDIYYVNLSRISVESLVERLNSSRGNILVFEDIDALGTGFAESRGNGGAEGSSAAADPPSGDDGGFRNRGGALSGLLGVSLSDILNITDGLLASDDTICLFTTNHIERLDPAFLRAGRMNFLAEFTKLDAPTAAKMIKANLGWDVPSSNLKEGINPAELQEAILRVALGGSTREDIASKFFAAPPKHDSP